MNYNIRGENIEVTPAIREYVEKKVAKLERYFTESPNANVNVNLKVYQDKKSKVEITIPMKDLVLRAEELHEDMYAAIDLITDKLERQIRKHKTKVNRKFRDKESLKDFVPIFTEVEQVEEDEDLEVVRTKSFDLKPMDSEEAILQMNMLGHSFYVFTNAETNQTNVVYKRNDGRYGLIEAQ
ncbi:MULTISPECIES: ribosome-associated translation inhibitor RaiA [Bacillaceae]|uniref:Ribosome hibernation promoting factor n=1 Tax=Mesobacillus selenatarsenatis (strain DSM 18680 / JCM 14380 / FERM P-15431 / SF-1) TaxID=1321606 RepID=A0A0A8WWH3_MESS1|nr:MULTISPECIES: ribosome-associated translation inhibitor RaiA [Bacillaceae]MBT2703862.1 ribosome-associated translation inhibitor RaiA [Chryseobacterium sp. ISL-80]MBT2678870.1 ribosome-associated translation inhibitor RaiA [Bacillus sp. ISL-35]MBT2685442.1 ribosome-associated translation inhibitor RaiA [Bacillus sp. ISL-37]MBT2693671.1 ribosome-associated translation inhibitor RaiA [Bacillus sp. ISL-55]GAM11985.1 ribosomal subunit interface protein [Mesobacillus selenatarsenatis SF-1]